MRACHVLLVSLCLLLLAPVGGQASAAEPLDLSHLLRHASQHSPELVAARARWQALRHQSNVVRRWPEPTVSGGVFLRPVETKVGPQRGRVGVMVPVPWPDKFRRRGQAVLARATVERKRVDARLARLEASIRQGWARRAWLQGLAHSYDAQRALLVSLESSVLTRLRVGKATYADAQRLRLMIDALKEKAASARDALRPTEVQLLALANLPPATKLGVAGFESDPLAGGALPPESAFAAGLNKQPDVIVQDAAIDAAQAQIAAAQTRSKPDFAVGLDWIVVGASSNPAAADSGNDALLLRTSVKLPVWGSTYDAEVDVARARRRQASANRTQKLQAARARLSQLLFNLRDARRKRLLYARDLVPRATSALQTVVQGYVNGRAAFQSVVEIQRQLLNYEIGLSTAERRRVDALASLEALMAAPLATFVRKSAVTTPASAPKTTKVIK